MSFTRPIFRIFDYNKAIEFYVNWMGFKIEWEDKKEGTPIYMEISLGDIVVHLSEHHGDCSPGARILIEDFAGIREYHAALIAKNYKYNKPGLEKAYYNPDLLCMEAIDPFGNRLTFTGV